MFAQLNKDQVQNAQVVMMRHLAECKTMTDNIANFIGISAVQEKVKLSGDGTNTYAKRQYFNVDKATNGETLGFPMERNFKFQRWNEGSKLQGGSQPQGGGG